MTRPPRRGRSCIIILHAEIVEASYAYASMYGRAFGTLLMLSTLGDIFTLWCVIDAPILRAEGTSVHSGVIN